MSSVKLIIVPTPSRRAVSSVASLVLRNTPMRIPDHIKRTCAGSRHASDAMRAFGVGEWCRQTLGYRLDTERA